MKKIFTIIAGLMLTVSVFAQAPEKMSYQAVVRNSSNALVTTQAVGMQISILQGGATGTAVYVETQTPTSNANGLVSLEIGTGTVVSGDFTTIDWANDTYFIKTETDLAGGTTYTITGTTQLMSVPYALHAKTAESVTGGVTETDPIYIASEAANITAGDITNLGNLSGTNTGDQDLSGYLTAETDPVFSSSVAGGITGADTANWNNYFSGDYNDLTNPPTIPTVPTTVSSFTNDAGYLTSFTEVDGSTTNEIQDISSVLTTGNDASGNSILNTGQIGLGTLTPASSAAIDMNTTTGALLLPRLTTVQRDALTPQEGMMIYNTSELKFQGYSYGSVIDQQHLIINNGGGEDRAQSFTAGFSGSLTSVELPLSAMMGAFDVNIVIRDGDGTGGTVLHYQSFTIPNGTSTWYTFPTVGVNVISGNSYTIHVTEVSSCGMPPCYNWGMDTSGDNYSGGLFYYGGTPYSGGIYDCAFKTNVTPINPLALQWLDLH